MSVPTYSPAKYDDRTRRPPMNAGKAAVAKASNVMGKRAGRS